MGLFVIIFLRIQCTIAASVISRPKIIFFLHNVDEASEVANRTLAPSEIEKRAIVDLVRAYGTIMRTCILVILKTRILH